MSGKSRVSAGQAARSPSWTEATRAGNEQEEIDVMRPTSHRTTAGLAALVVGVTLMPGHAQTKRTAGTFSQGPTAELHVGTACPGDMAGLSITLLNEQSLAGQTVTYHNFSNPVGVIGFSDSPDGPFEDTLDVSFTLDGSGSGTSDTFYYRAMKSGSATVEGCGPVGCTDNPFTVTVVGIDTVVISEINGPLDANPNAGGGLRIYPDKQSASDGVDRRFLRVQAIAAEPTPGVQLYFRAFDLDDPSSDARPIDPNHSAAGDNRGEPGGGTLSAPSAVTDALGIAEVGFAVTMQPGDNFKIGASCRSGYLAGARAAGVDVVDSSGAVLEPERGAQSEMITVWRKVHVELDSMGNVTGNRITGVIEGASPSLLSSTTTLTLPGTVDRGRFEGGVITITGVGTFRVLDSTRTTVDIEGTVEDATARGKAFVLVDDDDFNGDDPALLRHGDDGEDVPPPSMTLIADGFDNGVCDGTAPNVFGPAYVCPVFDVGDSNDVVPFVLHTPDSELEKIATYDFDAIGTEADPNFWTVYILGAYQFDTDQDNDPGGNLKKLVLGTVDALNGMGVSLFHEAVADAARSKDHVDQNCTDAVLAVHELGHLFRGVHSDGEIMSSGCSSMTLGFSIKTIATIRAIDHP
jgi:hypothetical protein